MMTSPLINHILARRPWLTDRANMPAFGFTARPEGLARPDRAIAQRLMAAYRRAQQQSRPDFRPNDVWRQFVQQHYGDMLALVKADDAEGLTDYLLALPRQGAGHGYFQGKLAWQALQQDPDKQRERALWLLDHLLGFAESLGVLRERCPEQGEWDTPAITSVPALCQQLQAATGLPLTLPPLFDGFFLLEPQAAPCHVRSLMPAYALHQIRQFFETTQGRRPNQIRLAEIGAGIGYTGYLAAHMNLARYSVFDLPEINLAQGFFLMCSVGPDNVRLLGEAAGPRIEVLPPWEFEQSIASGFDAVLNIDSLPEIAQDASQQYLQTMAGGAEYFVSINQEAPRPDPVAGQRESVRRLVERHTNFSPFQRNRNWLRAGYVDEIFRIQPA